MNKKLRNIFSLLVMLILGMTVANAQQVSEKGTRQPRILILLDASSSMLQPWGQNDIRFKAAAKIVSALMDSIYSVNRGVEFGLRVYGHQSPAQNNDCLDSRQEVMFSKNNFTQMGLRLASIRPFGVSPIAYSLSEAAANDLVDEAHNAYSIILITDGGESCGGNICDVVKSLIERKIFFKPYILSLVDYAPLKEQYACLGSYLQVANETELPIAINKIVDAYRPLLSQPIMMAKTEPVTTPSGPKPVIVEYTPRTTDKTAIAPLQIKEFRPISLPVNKNNRIPRFVALPKTVSVVPPPKEQEVVPPTISSAVGTPKLNTDVPRETVKNKQFEIPPPIVKKDTSPVATPAIVKRDTQKTTVVIKSLEPAGSTVKVTPVPKPPVDSKPKEATFTRQTEDAPETTLSILFTDGHGKFYASTPQLQLLDAASGKMVKQFYRTVDASGNPDPQSVTAGTYNLLVAGRANLLMRRILVESGKKNTIIVTVSNGSLRFYYEGNPDRPVDEFAALVNIRFEPGPTVKQRCNVELEYPPGNYHVELNTMPVRHYNTDIDFGYTTNLAVPQPGYVKFTNTNPVGEIALYYPLGNRFVQFHGLRITGNPEEQRLRLLPGAYEVHWKKNPRLPMAPETIEKFLVKSNAVTEIELH